MWKMLIPLIMSALNKNEEKDMESEPVKSGSPADAQAAQRAALAKISLEIEKEDDGEEEDD